MSWSVITAQEEDVWFKNYLDVAIGTMPPQVPPKAQVIGSTKISWWDGPPGKAVIMSEGGNANDRYLAEQIVLKDLEPFGYKRAYFSFSGFNKTAAWRDVMMKAVRLKNNGQVTIGNNTFSEVEAKVIGDHGVYAVNIKRDDPNSRVITQWTCDCPWDIYAFNRTRKWKYLEGRCCSHVLATYWQSLATPLNDYDEKMHGKLPGQKKGPNPNQMQMDMGGGGAGGGPRGGDGGASPGGVPKGFDIDDGGGSGGGPNGPQMPSTETSPSPTGDAPSSPAAPTAPSAPTGAPAKPPKPSPSRGQGQQESPGGEQLSLLSDPSKPTSEPSDSSIIPPSPVQQADQAAQAPFSQPKYEDDSQGRNQHLPGAFSKVMGKTFRFSAEGEERNSPFDPESKDNWNKPVVVQLINASDTWQDENGKFWPCEYGTAEGGSPDKGAGQVWPVRRNAVGLAFGYDYRLKWVTVHFPLHDSGPLEPHHVSVTLSEDKLALRPDVKNPFQGRR